jgi:hypothetical protein
VYDFKEGINEQLRPCFQTEIERNKKKTKEMPSFLSLRGVKRKRERALGWEIDTADKRIKGS